MTVLIILGLTLILSAALTIATMPDDDAAAAAIAERVQPQESQSEQRQPGWQGTQ